MSVDIPLSPWFSVLLLALPGVWRLGLWLAGRAVPESARLLAPALGLAAWMACVHLAARAVADFHVGLIVGTLLPGLTGTLIWKRARTGDGTVPWSLVMSAAAATLVILPATVGWDFFDRFPVGTGHFSLPAQILNGIYPPRELSFPTWTLPYHYGVDLLIAMVAALLRLRVDIALDLLTLGLWFYTLLLFGMLARRLAGLTAMVPAVLIGGFLGRFPTFSPGGNLTNQMLGVIYVHSTEMKGLVNPPLAANWFQPAWLVGVPLFLAALWLAAAEKGEGRPAPGLALCLIVLGFSNTTLFLCLAGALAGLAAWATLRRQPVAALGLALAGTLLAAPLIGGMLPLVGKELSGVGSAGSGLVLAAGGKVGDWGASLGWNVLSFGMALPAGIYGLRRLGGLRLLLALLLVGSLAIVNLLAFARSWDIIKFAGVAALVLALGCAATVAELLTVRRVAAWALVAVLSAGGLMFHLPFWLGRSDILEAPYQPAVRHLPELQAATPDERAAVAWLRRHVAAGEAVLCVPRLTAVCTAGGGLPQFFVSDFYPYQMGVPTAEIDRRIALQQELPTAAALVAENVVWTLIPPGEAGWSAAAEAWLAGGEARPAARFGAVQVLRLERR